MRKFSEYVQQQEIIDILSEIAAESQNNEELNQILIKEGFWGDIGKNVSWAATRGLRGIRKGIGDFFQGASQGGKAGLAGAAWDQRNQTDISQLEIKNAIESLNKAIPQIKDDKTVDGKNIKQWLSEIIELLRKFTA